GASDGIPLGGRKRPIRTRPPTAGERTCTDRTLFEVPSGCAIQPVGGRWMPRAHGRACSAVWGGPPRLAGSAGRPGPRGAGAPRSRAGRARARAVPPRPGLIHDPVDGVYSVLGRLPTTADRTMIRITLPDAGTQRLEDIFRTTADAKLRHRVQIVLMAHRGR